MSTRPMDLVEAVSAMRNVHRAFSEMDADLFWMGAFGKNRYVQYADRACYCLHDSWEAFSTYIRQVLADYPDMGSAILERFYEELGLDPETAMWADMERALELPDA